MAGNLYKKSISILLKLAILQICTGLFGQSEDEVRDIFLQAESYYLYEEYELANQLYLLIDNPDNMNVKYKIGACYLGIPGEKSKSIGYLKEAASNIMIESNSDSYKEMNAPLETYFYLAKAYMINNEFELALSILEKFIDLVKENDDFTDWNNFEFIYHQIEACKNAIQFRKVPVSFTKVDIGKFISDGAINENATISYDGLTMAYTERLGIESAIYVSRKINGDWQPALNITDELEAGSDCSTCSLNSEAGNTKKYCVFPQVNVWS